MSDIELTNLTPEQLSTLEQNLQKEKKKRYEEKRKEAATQIREVCKEAGMTLEEIMGIEIKKLRTKRTTKQTKDAKSQGARKKGDGEGEQEGLTMGS